jgi:hypothetical protein
MTTLTKISDQFKSMGTTITSIFGIIAAVGGAVIYVENNYAQASDVKIVIRNQSIQMKQNIMFQLEYYDDQIKKLEMEQSRNVEILSDKNVSKAARAYTRKPDSIQEEIKELKMRRDLVKRNLVQSEGDTKN